MNEEVALDLARKIRYGLKGWDYPNHIQISLIIQHFFASKYTFIKDVSKVLDLDDTLTLEDAARILDIAESKELENDTTALLDIINQHKKGITL
jgi:hypothetical protein